ncbi:MAG: carboxypeptidase regulatory-like domain-containing protein [Candidatus Hydrogenedentes bacterium]|nr:carboxypeptidase regulatory-like domain-containing protein [Candidatus Hydrogenedentota bacterium]
MSRRFATIVCTALLLLSGAGISFAQSADVHRVQGIVLDVQGNPLSNATVWLTRDRYVFSTRTDGQGQFEFDEVGTGVIGVVAHAPEYSIGGVERFLVEDTALSIVLREPGSIRVRIIDTHFNPVAGARVVSLNIEDHVRIHVDDLIPHGFPSARSDEEGFLTVPALPGDRSVSFRVAHRNFAEANVPPLPVGSELDIPLPPGVKVRGRVVNESGEGIEHARVSLFRVRATREQEFAEVLTDREGFYSAMVPPETYYVAARHGDYPAAIPVSVDATPEQENTADDIVLPAPHRVHGRVMDVKDDPVAYVRIAHLVDGVVFGETFSGPDGSFSVWAAMGDGIFRVSPPDRMITVARPDVPFTVSGKSEVDVGDIRLRKLPDIVGKVMVDEDVPRDRIVISTVGLLPPYWAITDETGAFSIPLKAMPPNARVRIRAEHALHFLRDEIEVDLTLDEPVSLQLRPFQPDLSPAPENTTNGLHHMVGKPAPELRCAKWFHADALDDEVDELSLAMLRGKVVVLTLWGGFATDGPGRHRIAEMRAIYQVFRGLDDVAVISVHDAGITPPDVEIYVSQYAIEFPVCCDEEPALTFDIYNTNVIPQTVLIDKKGVLRYFDVDGRILELTKALRRQN